MSSSAHTTDKGGREANPTARQKLPPVQSDSIIRFPQLWAESRYQAPIPLAEALIPNAESFAGAKLGGWLLSNRHHRMSEGWAGNTTQSPGESQPKLAVSQTSVRIWNSWQVFFLLLLMENSANGDHSTILSPKEMAWEKWIFTLEKTASSELWMSVFWVGRL